MDAVMAAPKEPVVPGESTLRAGLPNACRTLAILCSGPAPVRLLRSLLFHLLLFPPPSPLPLPPARTPPPSLSSLSRSFALPRLRDRLCRPPLGSLLARSFLLLEGTAFFLAAPAMGGTQTGLCPTNEKRNRGNASPGVLRQWRPSSSTTHRSSCSLSLTVPHRSLALPHRSPSPFSHLTVLLPPRAASTFQLSRFFLLLRILIFFINFSPSSPDGSPSSSLSLSFSLRLPISLQSHGLRYLLLISRFPPGDLSSACIRRMRRPTVFLANDLTYLVPSLGLLSRQCPCPSARIARIRSLHDRDTVSDISFYFFPLPNAPLLKAFAVPHRNDELYC